MTPGSDTSREIPANRPDDDNFRSEKAQAILNNKQYVVYRSSMDEFIEWMVTEGKDPENRKGLSYGCAYDYTKRLDQLYRYAWEELPRTTLEIDHDLADSLVEALFKDEFNTQKDKPYSNGSKRKFNDALRKYFEWRSGEYETESWSPPHKFNGEEHQPADFFTHEERQMLREASLEYGTIPAYSYCSPEQRDELKAHLAQKLGKPKSDVSPADWRRNNESWEIPSLIWISLDAGLRPIEVERANVDWLRPEKQTLLIPKESSAKGRENWEVALKSQTAEIAKRWLVEREHLEKYGGSDALWLTREQNRRSSASLCPLIRDLCEEAGIDLSNRDITWYSIRHSLGQYMTDIGGIEQAQAQLRHKSLDSTMKYTKPTLEQRRKTLDKL